MPSSGGVPGVGPGFDGTETDGGWESARHGNGVGDHVGEFAELGGVPFDFWEELPKAKRKGGSQGAAPKGKKIAGDGALEGVSFGDPRFVGEVVGVDEVESVA